ncbi:MAG: type II toxin-antitoxin system RelE/ParE family toxin [Opitutales bacterium]|nr:type II toxin-antitoxin system RelE/ParE family toxin [Opitutales bacterium]
MKVRFLSIAEIELDEAIAYYEGKESGLGLRFFSEIKNAVERIVAYPKAWSPLSLNTRRCRTKIFPYGIIYQSRESEIVIVAISSLHRDPGHWKDRL